MSTMLGAGDDGAAGELVPVGPPRTLRANLWATAVWCALTVLSNVVLFGQRAYERKQLIDLNSKAAHPKNPYGGAVLDHDVHNALMRGLIVSLLVSVILMLLAALTWRGRPWARWVLLALAVLGAPFGVGVLAQLVLGTLASLPGLYKVTVILAGFAAVAVVVLLLHRTTREYFRALRETQRGNLPVVPGSRATGMRPAGGLGALFAPRRRPVRVDSGGASSSSGAPGADNSSTSTVAPSSGGTASRRAKPTRPGSVKPKSTGNRPGRFKSRQQ